MGLCVAASPVYSGHKLVLAGNVQGPSVGLIGPLQGVVAQQLLDQVNMCHDHAPATIPRQLQGIQGLSAREATRQEQEEVTSASSWPPLQVEQCQVLLRSRRAFYICVHAARPGMEQTTVWIRQRQPVTYPSSYPLVRRSK